VNVHDFRDKQLIPNVVIIEINLHYASRFELTRCILHQDSEACIVFSMNRAKKGGDNIGFSGHKKVKGDKVGTFCDRP